MKIISTIVKVLLLRPVLSTQCPISTSDIQVSTHPSVLELDTQSIEAVLYDLPIFYWDQDRSEECGSNKFFYLCTGCAQNQVQVAEDQLVFSGKGPPGSSFVLHISARWPNGVVSVQKQLQVKYRSMYLQNKQEKLMETDQQISQSLQPGVAAERSLQQVDCQVVSSTCSLYQSQTYNVGDGSKQFELQKNCMDLSPVGCSLTKYQQYVYWAWEEPVVYYDQNLENFNNWLSVDFDAGILTLNIMNSQVANLWAKAQDRDYLVFNACYQNTQGKSLCIQQKIYIQLACPTSSAAVAVGSQEAANTNSCPWNLSVDDQESFIKCGLAQSCTRYITLQNLDYPGSYPYNCVKVRSGSLFITESSSVDGFASSLIQWDSSLKVTCNALGIGQLALSFISDIDSCLQSAIVTIECVCPDNYNMPKMKEFGTHIQYNSCQGAKTVDMPPLYWAPENACGVSGGQPTTITEDSVEKNTWLNWTPTWSTFTNWYTKSDQTQVGRSNTFEAQNFTTVDLSSKKFTLDYCQPEDNQIRQIYLAVFICCYSFNSYNFMTGKLYTDTKSRQYGYFVAFDVNPPPDCTNLRFTQPTPPASPFITTPLFGQSDPLWVYFVSDSVSDQSGVPFSCGHYEFTFDVENQNLQVTLLQDSDGKTWARALCEDESCIGEWSVKGKVVLKSGGGPVGYWDFRVKILCQSKGLIVDNPYLKYIDGATEPTIPYFYYRLGSGPQSFSVSSITQDGVACDEKLTQSFQLWKDPTGADDINSCIGNLQVDTTNPSDATLGWLYVLSDNSAIVVDAYTNFPAIDNYNSWSNVIVMLWFQNKDYSTANIAGDGFYIQMLPDCNLARFIDPTISSPIIISSLQPPTYLPAFDDDFTITYGPTINSFDTCGLRTCSILTDSPNVSFYYETQQFSFSSLVDLDVEGSYSADLQCQLKDFSVPILSITVSYQVLPCSYTSLTTDNTLTDTVVNYEYASGDKSFSFDKILTTSPECRYSTFEYSLNTVLPSTDTLLTLGITVDNSVAPAKFTVNQTIIGQTKTVDFEWSAIPTANPSQTAFPLKFSILFSNPCDTATYTAPTLSDIHLNFLGPIQTFSFDPFTDSVSTRLSISEACGPWTYTITSPRSDEANFSLTKITDRQWTLQFVTNSAYTFGTNYPLTLNALLSGVQVTSASVNLYLEACITQSISFSTTNLYKDTDVIPYKIGDTSNIFKFLVDQTPACGYTFKFDYQVDSQGLNTPPAWMTATTYLTYYPQFELSSISTSHAGSYSLNVLVSILDVDGNPQHSLDQSLTVQLSIVDPCLSATWDAQTITDISQPVFNPLFSQSFTAFTVSTGTSSAVDCGAVTYTLVPVSSLATLDTTTYSIKVQSTDLSQIGTYPVKLVGQLVNYSSIANFEVPFQIIISACVLTSISALSTNVIQASGSYSYTIGDPAASYTFYYDQTPACLRAYTSTFKVNSVASSGLPWITLSQDSSGFQYPVLQISTADTSYAGTQSIDLLTTVNDGTTTISNTVSFTFVLSNPCLTAAWVLPSIADMTTTVLASPALPAQIFSAFTLNTSVNCGSITYTLGTVLAFVTVTSIDRSITVTSTLSSEVGPHANTIQATLDSYTTVAAGVANFNIQVNPCLLSSITPTQVLQSSFTYTIGNSALILSQEYTQSPLCNYAFSYSYKVDSLATPTLTWLTMATTTTFLYPQVTVSTTDITFAGTHPYELTTSVNDGTKTLTDVVSFDIILIDPCITATWNSLTIADISQSVMSPLYSQTYIAFTVTTGTLNTVDCGTLTYNLVPALTFVAVDASTSSINVQTTDLSQVGTYPVKLVGTLDRYPSFAALEVPFTINIQACTLTSITVQTNAIQSGGSQTYQIGDPSVSYTFYYSQTPNCQLAYTYTYTVNTIANPSLAWLTVSSDGSASQYPVFAISTSDTSFTGSYSVVLTTSADDGATTISNTVSFTLVLSNPCLTAAWVLPSIADMTTTVLASPALPAQIFSAFTLNTAVNCGSITYTLGTVLAFVTVTSIDRSITVSPTLATQVSSYTNSIQATLDSYTTVSAGVANFNIIVNPCVLSSITATLVQPLSFPYTIGDPSLVISQQYTQSPLCDYAFSYSYKVDNLATPTLTWLTMATTTTFLYPQITVSTSDTSFAGTHPYELTTSVNDGTKTLSDVVSFDIVLSDPCLSAAWNTVTLSNMVTSVLVNPTLAPQTFAQFSLSTSVVCGSVNYDLSPSLAFVTMDATARTITVISTTQPEAGTYQMTLTGTLASYSTRSLPATFAVTINPCALTSVTVASTGFGFTKTITIFSTGYSFQIATYTQTPTCGYTPTYLYQADTTPSTGFATQPFFSQLDATTLLVSTSDYTLDGKTYTLRQQTLISSTIVTQTGVVSFVDPCKTTSFVSQSVLGAYAFISSSLTPVVVTLPVLSDTVSQIYVSTTTTPTCSAQNVAVTSNGVAIPFMTQSTSVDGVVSLTFASDLVANVGKYKVDVLYSLSRYPAIQQLVSFDLSMYLLLLPAALSDQTYQVGQVAMIITSNLFEVQPATSTLTFTYTSSLDNGNPLPAFISGINTLTNYQYTVYSSQTTDVGTYVVRLSAVVSGPGQSTTFSTSFTLVVTAPPPGIVVYQPPYFVSDLVLEQSAFAGESWEYQLPDYLDPQQSPVTLSAVLSTASIFMSFSSGKLTVLEGATQASNVGTYSIQIQLKNDLGAAFSQVIKFEVKAVVEDSTDDESVDSTSTDVNTGGELATSTESSASGNTVIIQPSAASSAAMAGASESAKQTFAALASAPTLVLKGGNSFNWGDAFAKTQNKKSDPSRVLIPPNVSIKKVSNTGTVTLSFTTPMINPPIELIQDAKVYNKTIKRNQPALIVTVLPSRYSDPNNLTFTYNITLYTPTSLTIQLNFKDPSVVSSFAEPDQVQVQFAGSIYFFNQDGQTIQPWKTLSGDIPQLQQKQKSVISEATIASLQSATNGFMIGNFMMNLVLSAGLQQLWTMINTQQIIVMLPLFRVTLPPDAQIFFGFVMQLAAFNLLPTDLFYDTYFSSMKQAETGAINDNFDSDGFGSVFFIYNMGTLMVAIISMPLLIVVNYTLKLFRNRHKRIQTAYQKISNYLFWSHSITVVFESYSMVCVSAFINSTHMTYGSYGEIISSSLTIGFLVVCVALPFIFAIFMISKFPILSQENMRKKFGNMYTNLDLSQGKWITVVPFNFLVRRFVIGVSVVYQNQISIQVITVLVGVFVEITVNGFVSPYQDPFLHTNVYFNEIIIVTTMYSFMCFTDFLPDLTTKKYMGFTACLTVCLHLAVNIFFMIKASLHQATLKLKRWLARRKTKNVVQAKITNTSLETTLQLSNIKLNQRSIVNNSTAASFNSQINDRIARNEIPFQTESIISNGLTSEVPMQISANELIDSNQNIKSNIFEEKIIAKVSNPEPQVVDWDQFMEKMNKEQRNENQQLKIARQQQRNELIPESSQTIAEAEEIKLKRRVRMDKAKLAQAIKAMSQIDGRTASQRMIDELFPASFLQESTNAGSNNLVQQSMEESMMKTVSNDYFYSDARVESQANQFKLSLVAQKAEKQSRNR